VRAAAIHGNKSQAARVRALSDFKENRITALVATEVAARGLDIRELPHVVNFELPNVPEDYVHRIGRTARAGGSGSAISLVAPQEGTLLKDIEKVLGHSLPLATLPPYAVNPPRRTAAAVTPAPTSGGVPRTPVYRAQPRRHGHHPSPRSHGTQSALPRARRPA